MSWEAAKLEADKWLSTLDLPKDVRNQLVDLTQHTSSLQATGRFRIMILQAAARALKKRGANVSWHESP